VKINWNWPGLVWLEHAGENAVGAAAIGAGTVLGSGQFHLISDVPWWAVVSAGAIAGLGSLLKALGSLHFGPGKQNGTASLNPHVVSDRSSTP
jgi:hypothetical protein